MSLPPIYLENIIYNGYYTHLTAAIQVKKGSALSLPSFILLGKQGKRYCLCRRLSYGKEFSRHF
jgi:hypothetical protein